VLEHIHEGLKKRAEAAQSPGDGVVRVAAGEGEIYVSSVACKCGADESSGVMSRADWPSRSEKMGAKPSQRNLFQTQTQGGNMGEVTTSR